MNKNAFALVGIGVCAVAFAVSDIVNREYSPVAETVSRYVNTGHGWLVPLGLFALALASLVVAAGLRGAPRVLVGLWAAGIAVAGVFPADPPGRWHDPSVAETVHGYAAWVALLALFAAMVVLRRDARVLTAAGGVTLLLFLVSILDAAMGTHSAPVGLAERAVLVVDLLWLAKLTTTPRTHPATNTAEKALT